MNIMNDLVKDDVGNGWFADYHVPCANGNWDMMIVEWFPLGLLNDFHHYRSFVSIERLKAEVIKDPKIQTSYFTDLTDILAICLGHL